MTHDQVSLASASQRTFRIVIQEYTGSGKFGPKKSLTFHFWSIDKLTTDDFKRVLTDLLKEQGAQFPRPRKTNRKEAVRR